MRRCCKKAVLKLREPYIGEEDYDVECPKCGEFITLHNPYPNCDARRGETGWNIGREYLRRKQPYL